MNLRPRIEALLYEYASGKRPQNDVTDDILLLINDGWQEGREVGYADGYEDGYSDATNEIKDKMLKLAGEL
jgi:flagellar biosynthesis/type III secretory pathway protein FliH